MTKFHRIVTWIKGRRAPSPESSAHGPLYPAVRDALGMVQDYARSHGGSIELVEVTHDGEVVVRMRGTCSGCPLAEITLKHGVEGQLKLLVPGVTRVTRIR